MSKILIVDDESSIRSALTALFKELGHQVHAAQNGREAVFIVDFFKPDLVILDQDMPGLDGFWVLKNISAKPDRPAVLMLLDQGDGTAAREAVDCGAYDCLSKPLDIDSLQKKVEDKLNPAPGPE